MIIKEIDQQPAVYSLIREKLVCTANNIIQAEVTVIAIVARKKILKNENKRCVCTRPGFLAKENTNKKTCFSCSGRQHTSIIIIINLFKDNQLHITFSNRKIHIYI